MASNEFMIRHPETGAEYGLHSVDVFRERYEPLGYVVPADQPHGWIAPKGVKTWAPPVEKPAVKTAKAPKVED